MGDPRLNSLHLDPARRQDYRRAREALLQSRGVETIYAQIAADALEVPIERIRHVYHGSTGLVSDGYGAYHSRSVVMGGSAVLDATRKFLSLLRAAAAKRRGT